MYVHVHVTCLQYYLVLCFQVVPFSVMTEDESFASHIRAFNDRLVQCNCSEIVSVFILYMPGQS